MIPFDCILFFKHVETIHDHPIVKWRQVSLWKKVIRLKHGHGLFQSSGTPEV